MGQNLSDFLVSVASDPERTARFAADPARELQSSGLSGEDQAIVLTRDSRKLVTALGARGFAVGDVSNKKKRKPPTRPKPPGKKKRPARKGPGRPAPKKKR